MKVLVIGETCFDKFIYGECKRLCPAAPVPVFSPIYEKTTEGMAANVYRNLEAFEKIYQKKISFDLWTNDSYNEKVRYVDEQSNQMILRVDKENSYVLNKELWNPKIEEYDAIIVSDYNKGLLNESDLKDIGERAKISFIDTKKKNLKAFNGAYVKINEKEFETAESYAWDMIITLGAEGAMLRSELVNTNYPTKKVGVLDVCGAGDTFLAALAYQYLVTNSIDDAIKFANKASAITVQHVGNYAPTLKEIK